MRKFRVVAPIFASLLYLAVPVWGETLSAPEMQSAGVCPAPAASGTLPGLLPQPLFKSTGCGSCSDPGCQGVPLGMFCGFRGAPAYCTGLIVGSETLMCPEGGYECRCVFES